MDWIIHHKSTTASTNLDARAGTHGEVFTADFQTSGRGRLNHKWFSGEAENLLMSAVLSVEGMEASESATLPLVVGLAIAETLGGSLKWPNDVLVRGKKLAGILCERQGDKVIAGIGVNVLATSFPEGIVATSLALERAKVVEITKVRDLILKRLGELYSTWREFGFKALYDRITKLDVLKGREIAVRQTDDDLEPTRGLCYGIMDDGTLKVGEERIYAGEAHVL